MLQVLIVSDHKFTQFSAAHSFEAEEQRFLSALLTSSDQAALVDSTAPSSLFPSDIPASKRSVTVDSRLPPVVARLQVAITDLSDLRCVHVVLELEARSRSSMLFTRFSIRPTCDVVILMTFARSTHKIMIDSKTLRRKVLRSYEYLK